LGMVNYSVTCCYICRSAHPDIRNPLFTCRSYIAMPTSYYCAMIKHDMKCIMGSIRNVRSSRDVERCIMCMCLYCRNLTIITRTTRGNLASQNLIETVKLKLHEDVLLLDFCHPFIPTVLSAALTQ